MTAERKHMSNPTNTSRARVARRSTHTTLRTYGMFEKVLCANKDSVRVVVEIVDKESDTMLM